jgi:hypothetical protein
MLLKVGVEGLEEVLAKLVARSLGAPGRIA